MSDKSRKILAGVVTVVLVILINIIIGNIRQQGVYDSTIQLNNGWTLIFHGDTTEIESTEQYVMTDKIAKGDSLILRRKITPDIPDNPVLRFKTYHTFVEAFRDNGRLYTNGESNYYKGELVGSGVHFIYLGAILLEGKTLELKFHFAEKNAMSVLPAFEVLPANYAFGDFYARNSMSLVVGLFLLLFGVLALLLSAGMLYYGIAFFRILMIGIMALCLGVWTLCYTKLIQLFSFNFAFNTCLEYTNLYLTPLPMCLLLLHMRSGRISRQHWWGFVTIVAFDVLLLVVSSILNYTNIVHFPKTLWVFHTYAILSLAYLLIAGISNRQKIDAPTKILAIGVSVFGAISVLDVLRFNVMMRFHLEHTSLSMTWLPMGTLAFVILLALSYLVYMYQLLSEKAEKDILSILAYKDSLTGIHNRAKCQQHFDSLDKAATDYAIISIDLNGLKRTNDHYGHNEGDRLIKTFAIVLRDAFAGIGTAFRMGGDEFLAIVRKKNIAKVDEALAKMAKLQKTHRADLPIALEAAYGMAYKHELLKDANGDSAKSVHIKAEDVYRLADERMYAMKAQMKSELVRK